MYGLVSEIEGEHETRYQYRIAPAYDYKWLNFPAGDGVYDRLFAHNYRPRAFGYLISKSILVDGKEVYREFNGYSEFESGHVQ